MLSKKEGVGNHGARKKEKKKSSLVVVLFELDRKRKQACPAVPREKKIAVAAPRPALGG